MKISTRIILSVLLLIASTSTFFGVVFANLFINVYAGASLATIYGLLGVFTCGWQVKLAFNMVTKDK